MLLIPIQDESIFVYAVGFRVGAINETKRHAGISHFLEHLMFESKSKTNDDIETFKRIGAVWNATTGLDFTMFHIKCNVQDAPAAIKALTSIVGELNITSQKFDLERRIVIEEMLLTDNMPDVFDIAHRGTPYRNSVIGTKETLNNITMADLKAYHERMYVNPVLCLACSKRNKTQLQKLVSKATRRYKTTTNAAAAAAAATTIATTTTTTTTTNAAAAVASTPTPTPNIDVNARRILDRKITRYFRHFPNQDYESCQLAFLGFPMSDPRSTCALLVAHILQERVTHVAREKEGLVYSFKVDHIARAHAGCFTITFKTKASILQVLKIMQKILKDMQHLKQFEILEFKKTMDKHIKLLQSDPLNAVVSAMKRQLFNGPTISTNKQKQKQKTIECFNLAEIFSSDRMAFIMETRKQSTKRKQDASNAAIEKALLF